MKRKITALFLAVVAALSSTVTVYAEEAIEQRETVRVGNYNCWVEDGEYYTEYNGEVCQVINLDEMTPRPVDEVQALSDEADWEHANIEMDISDGSEYQGLINIKKMDDYTPIFVGAPDDTDYSYQISTKFKAANQYQITVYTYSSISNEWSEYDMSVIFGSKVNKKILVSGTAANSTSKCCVYFHRAKSSGEKVFYYWFQQIEDPT